MAAKLATATLKGATPLKPEEAALIASVVATRPRGWWSRLRHGLALAAKLVSREEFDRICVMTAKELDGQTLNPDDAAQKARRLIEAYTQAKAGVICPKCDVTETAVLVAWLGTPSQGFLFQRGIKLKDPKGVKRG